MSDRETSKSNNAFIQPAGCILRLIWMVVGFAALAVTAYLIIQHKAFTLFDALFWAIVLVCVVSRFLDVAYLNGETCDGKPALMTHWRRYSLFLLGLALPLWGLAHGIGFLLR